MRRSVFVLGALLASSGCNPFVDCDQEKRELNRQLNVAAGEAAVGCISDTDCVAMEIADCLGSCGRLAVANQHFGTLQTTVQELEAECERLSCDRPPPAECEAPRALACIEGVCTFE